ncbi:MAG: glycoside hydrolase family 32 protein [Clostridia bacterium]|nr:glycoside hydrolase family 32 protein [Clostridia bacterium]
MDYKQKLKFHYKPKKGWINDPNGLVEYKGQYHLFYQHSPNCEAPWYEPMHWGHAVTKDFVSFTELPIALYPDMPYDKDGVWSGTAIVSGDVLYLFYASVAKDGQGNSIQSVSMAYSTDGINFTKCDANPIIKTFPVDGSKDFRDPAVTKIGNDYYLVIASGDVSKKTANLLLYTSSNLINWDYLGVLAEWQDCIYCECSSIMQFGDKLLVSTSVCKKDSHYFSIMLGDFIDNKFTVNTSAFIDKGPDQYAGQIFKDTKNRCILISWVSGWAYANFTDNNIGCMSLPKEILLKDGKIVAYPIKEVQGYLSDSDTNLKLTKDGFIVKRTNRTPVVYKGKINDLSVVKDGYVLEVFINGGEEVYTAVL